MVHNPLIVAIDAADMTSACELISATAPAAGMIKLGLGFFCANGPQRIMRVHRFNVPIMLDLKLHDIPSQVAIAIEALHSLTYFGVKFVTVHAAGGVAMMGAAVNAARSHNRLKILAVITLTSSKNLDLDEVMALAEDAVEAGVDGIVCPVACVSMIRRWARDWIIVTPGIRPAGDDLNDHAHAARGD